MDKKQFFTNLRQILKKLPQEEIENAISYYDEMISDKIDAGMTEVEAIESLGDIYKLRAYIMAGNIETKMSQKDPKSPIKSFFTVLALCSSPVLIIIGIALLISLFAVVFSFIVTALSLFASALGVILGGIVSTYYVATSIGIAAGLMSLFAYIFVAALLIMLGLFVLKALIIIVKLIVKLFAKVVRRNSCHQPDNVQLSAGGV